MNLISDVHKLQQRKERKDQKKGVWVSTAVGILVGVLLCSTLILLRLQIAIFSPISLAATITAASSSAPSAPSLTSISHSTQPPPEMGPGKISKEVKGGQFPQQPSQSLVFNQFSCDRTSDQYDLCTIDGPTVVDPTVATFFAVGVANPSRPTIVEKIQPYPRKFDNFIMAHIKDVTLISGPKSPPCKVHHKVPALVFSAGGHTGNFFHDFNDGFIPLFITVMTIFGDQDFVIVISEAPDWWLSKYAALLNMFSKHPIISLKNDYATHCFPSAHLGLITHGFMVINHTLLPNSKTYLHFRDMLHKAYGQHNQSFMSKSHGCFRPRLVLLSRSDSTGRRLINQKRIIKVMKEVGFDVLVFKPIANTSLHESYALISSCHAMIGVHGAVLTHSLFLRPGTVFMQIVSIGVEWAADAFFGRVGRGLNLEYIEYRIGVEESSLVDKYGKDSLLLKNPFALQKNNGWPIEIMDTYLRAQDVKLDLVRFKGYLKDAYKKAKKFMQKGEGNSVLPKKKER